MSQEILQQYLLSQTSILEYLPRSKLAKVTSLPSKVLDQLYDQLAGFDDNIQNTVQHDIGQFVSELGPLMQSIVQDAQLQDDDKENADHALLEDDHRLGTTLIDDTKLDQFSRAITQELILRRDKKEKERENILKKIENHAARVGKRRVEIAYDFSSSVNRSSRKLKSLETRLNKIDFD